MVGGALFLTRARACHGRGRLVERDCSSSACLMVIPEATRLLFPMIGGRSPALYASGVLVLAQQQCGAMVVRRFCPVLSCGRRLAVTRSTKALRTLLDAHTR